jgi:hypothetical protein
MLRDTNPLTLHEGQGISQRHFNDREELVQGDLRHPGAVDLVGDENVLELPKGRGELLSLVIVTRFALSFLG